MKGIKHVLRIFMALLHAFTLPVILVLIWFLAEKFGFITGKLIPGPQRVFGEAAIRIFASSEIYHSIAASVQRIFFGWAIAVVVGVSAGVLTSMSRRARLVLQGPMNACRPLPPAALVPLVVIWLGFGNAASISLVAFIAVWPVLINTISGMESVPQAFREAALTMGSTTRQMIITVLIPAAFPDIFVGMRLAIGLAWMTVVLSEIVGVKYGVGAQLLSLQQNNDVAAMLLLVMLIGAIGFLLDWLFRAAIGSMLHSHKRVTAV